MKRKMIIITAILSVGFAASLPIFLLTKNVIAESIVITTGITLYHFAMRLAVGFTIDAIMHNKADHNNAWFRERRFESGLYNLLRVRRWKKHLPTYSPDTFDPGKKNVKEILGATCQAEVVHEVIMVLSLLPITLISILGGGAVIIITSVLAMMFDSLFVILQRYNRPKLVRIMERFERIENNAVNTGSD